MTKPLKLGLIGDNIAASESPNLHRTAGRLAGVEVSYSRLVPKEMGLEFEEVFAHAQENGFDGVNVTYPYKERVCALVDVKDTATRNIGAINTVVFSNDSAQGFNTDHSGFIRAYHSQFDDAAVGVVCLIGAGGVGRAVAFALLSLKATKIICVDQNEAKAKALAQSLTDAGTTTKISISNDAQNAAFQANGIINCTPVGMTGIGGTPLPASAMRHAFWAFDAVYTPVETTFLQDAKHAGLTVMSGYELFFAQGLDAWALFSNTTLAPAELRAALTGELS